MSTALRSKGRIFGSVACLLGAEACRGLARLVDLSEVAD